MFFFSPTLGDAVHYLGQIFGAGGLGFMDSAAKYYLRENLILLIAGFILCGPLVENLFINITAQRSRLLKVVAGALYTLAVVWCIACMVGATYSTFLYFQF